MMTPMDQILSDEGLNWHRYVDDYTVICLSREDAYRALSTISHTLADYGLTLNRTKTTFMTANHYRDYVQVQLGHGDETSLTLREIDLHYDPYTDAPNEHYADLKNTVASLDIERLLDLEKNKSQPDTFLVSQISRTLRFNDPDSALSICKTFLNSSNLHSFRASWSTIMRGMNAIRSSDEFKDLFSELDKLLDLVPDHSKHLLRPEANLLHYLRIIRHRRTDLRGQFVRKTYDESKSDTVRRSCIDCWSSWKDRPNFTKLRNSWSTLNAEEQRMVWLVADRFGDEGIKARSQLRNTVPSAWRLGIESDTSSSFASLFADWAKNVH